MQPPLARRGLLACLTLLAAALPSGALGWGETGHRIICEIAWSEMARPTRQRVRELLPDQGRYRRFHGGCVWADDIRRDPRYRHYAGEASRHYVNVEPGDARVEPERDCPERCVLEAIEHYRGRLVRAADLLSRREALFFLSHYVGDVHQPLHAGYAADRGGNALAVRYLGREPECQRRRGRRRCSPNLHSLWDELLVTDALARSRHPRDWSAYARALHARLDAGVRAQLKRSAPLDWANESLGVVRAEIYPFLDGQSVTAAEVARYGLIAERRLLEAGIRLGALLDAALGPPRPEGGPG